jgi:hypothetical protein
VEKVYPKNQIKAQPISIAMPQNLIEVSATDKKE